jgi:protein-L-isoaspartate O-methyltransferase
MAKEKAKKESDDVEDVEENGDDLSIPFALRVRAWWEGYDGEEMAAAYKRKYGKTLPSKAGKLSGDAKPSGGKAPKKGEKPEEGQADQADEELDFEPWDDKRIDIAQYIWGDGYCGPGGPEHIIAMSKLLALTPKMSLMEVGSGLGGPGRTLADTFGVWVTGYEASQPLVDAGNELSKMAGMSKKVEITHYDPEDASKLDRTFDRVFAKDAMLTIQNKKQLVNACYTQTKAEGLMLMTEYVLGQESSSGVKEFQEWRDKEPFRIYPVTSDDLVDMVKDSGFSVRVNEDITQSYIELIARAWAGADKVVAQLVEREDGPAMIDTLLKEAEYWNRRSKLMEAGHLKVWRILGYKKMEKKIMMSDW